MLLICTLALSFLGFVVSGPAAIPHLLLFSPDVGMAVITVSVLLLFFEMNRPGLILPACLGLTGLLLSVSSWRQWHLSPIALLILAAGAALPLWQLRHRSSPRWVLLSALLFAVGFRSLVAGPGSARVHLPVAIACGLALGCGASLLARIAYSARRNKGLN